MALFQFKSRMSTTEEEERGNKENRKGTERSLQEARLKRERLKGRNCCRQKLSSKGEREEEERLEPVVVGKSF